MSEEMLISVVWFGGNWKIYVSILFVIVRIFLNFAVEGTFGMGFGIFSFVLVVSVVAFPTFLWKIWPFNMCRHVVDQALDSLPHQIWWKLLLILGVVLWISWVIWFVPVSPGGIISRNIWSVSSSGCCWHRLRFRQLICRNFICPENVPGFPTYLWICG